MSTLTFSFSDHWLLKAWLRTNLLEQNAFALSALSYYLTSITTTWITTTPHLFDSDFVNQNYLIINIEYLIAYLYVTFKIIFGRKQNYFHTILKYWIQIYLNCLWIFVVWWWSIVACQPTWLVIHIGGDYLIFNQSFVLIIILKFSSAILNYHFNSARDCYSYKLTLLRVKDWLPLPSNYRIKKSKTHDSNLLLHLIPWKWYHQSWGAKLR